MWWYLGKDPAASPDLPPLAADTLDRIVVWPVPALFSHPFPKVFLQPRPLPTRGRGLGGARQNKAFDRIVVGALVSGATALTLAWFAYSAAHAGVATVRYDNPVAHDGEVATEICNARDLWVNRKGVLVVGVDEDGDGIDERQFKFSPRHHVLLNPHREC